MNEGSLKIKIEIPGWSSLDSIHLFSNVKEKVLSQLIEQNYNINESIINRSCKNALSLARSRKKTELKCLVVYIPRPFSDSSPSSSSNSASSMEVEDYDSDEHEHLSRKNDISSASAQLTFEYKDNKCLEICTNFAYLEGIFSEFLSHPSKSRKLSCFVDDICSHCFNSAVKFYVNLSKIRRELCSQLSCFIRDAKKKVKVGHTTVKKVLCATWKFIFHLSTVETVNKSNEFFSSSFDSYSSVSFHDRILLIREKDTICIERGNARLYMQFSESLATRALEKFNSTRSIDADEIILIIKNYCQQRQLIPNINKAEEDFKIAVLDRQTEIVKSKFFTCLVEVDDKDSSPSGEQSFDLDVLLGPIYSTRGIKRKSQYVSFDSESSDEDECSNIRDNIWQSDLVSCPKKDKKQDTINDRKEELRRQFLHIKDEHHITDSAIKAMYKFFKESRETFYPMAEIERVRKKANQKIPIKFTSDSAYVPFEFALRTAVFVAMKFQPDILQLSRLSFRLNMDGTLMGNKHVIAISVNCVDGGPSCQTARKLVPVGIFEIQKESNELLRKTLPKDFLDSIQSVKSLKVSHKKYVEVKLRLGGDFQNAVYVFGLAGVHSNYPCVFCTQSKTYLHVSEKNTECEEEVWVGTGKNKSKQKRKIIVNPTSSYDPTQGARTLKEKCICLVKKEKAGTNNELGYQSEPLFGNLFEFSDYVIDSLHMRLRIFDILLKDILAEASRTGEYEPAHTKRLEEKVDILNKHSAMTIGKRFFFKIETENNVKTIVPCGRFSGHLQEVFFIDSFPYEKIIQNEKTSENAKNLVEKFKTIVKLIKTEKSKRTSVLADVAKSFVKDFRQSGLRTGCTPYMHLIGTHLAEQDANEDLRAYDMQGVEKSNDLLSRLYFSSSNRAKNPLKTMIQSLYRRLEMNFTEPSERVIMSRYALQGRLNETDNEEDGNCSNPISTPALSLHRFDDPSTDDDENEEDDDNVTDEEDSDQALSYLSQNALTMSREKNRWESFRKK